MIILRRGRDLLFACAIVTTSSSFQPNPVSQTLQVPEGFTIERAVDPSLISYPMFASFDEQGRLYTFEATQVNDMGTAEMLKNPLYHVRRLEDTDGDGVFDKSGIFASNIPLPMGGSFLNGSLYVSEAPNLVKYTDTDNDGKADKREVILSGWKLNSNAATLSGPFLGPDGWLYLPDARRGFDITTKEGKNLTGKGARIWRCKPDGSELESMSGGGFDNAIEIAFMSTGEAIGTMTYFVDPQGGFRDALMHWTEGGVYSKPHSVVEEDKLKLTGGFMPVMTKTARVAPSGLMRYAAGNWGNEFEDNLFSAEFNTGRIMRHVVSKEGASYKTVDTPFITSLQPDTHPTDVLQDADGSMLVVLTGGWFIEGCPLSRVAKPDVLGGLYRIRRKGTKPIVDPRGNQLNWSTATVPQLAARLKDNRPAVRMRTFDALVAKGNAALAVLKMHVQTAKGEQKLQALFALGRINTQESQAAVRTFLHSPYMEVRSVAARMAGMTKDSKAAAPLLTNLSAKDVSVRRQAATALGQIGDASATTALLKASSVAKDRFEEHAIIYSLIQLGNESALVNALTSSEVGMQKAALIALDQMDGEVLQKSHVEPFLMHTNNELRATAAWVLTHHETWADLVVKYLKAELRNDEVSVETRAGAEELLVRFSGQPIVQRYIAEELSNKTATIQRKQLFLAAINKSSVGEFPSAWTQSFTDLLNGSSSELIAEVLRIVQARRLSGFNDALKKLSVRPEVPEMLRVKSIQALTGTQKDTGESEFGTLLQFLDKQYSAPVRQAASNVLSQSALTDSQLERVIQLLPTAEAFLLPTLMEVVAKGKSEQIGRSFVKTVTPLVSQLNNFSEADLLRILANYPTSIKQDARPLITALAKQQEARVQRLEKIEASLVDGDVLEGRKLFYGKAACSACHAVESEGGSFGPDLTSIGDIRSRQDILEAILFPNASFAREYETVLVKARSGEYIGIIKEESAQYILLEVGPNATVRLEKSEIESTLVHGVSMMPPGLEELLSGQELSHLMAFLESLPDGIPPVAVKR